MRTSFGVISILFIILSSCLGSCGWRDREYCAEIMLADSLMQTNPDAALARLDILDSTPQLDEHDRMRSRLLRIEANDRKLVQPKYDSTIKALLEYYIDGDNDEELHPRVLYYAGRIYSDLGKSSDAMRYFKQSLESLGKDNDLDLQSRSTPKWPTFLQNIVCTGMRLIIRKSK